MKIAIDGPSGAGKSTLSKAVAQQLGIIYVDTGALYRTVGYAIREAEIVPDDQAAVIAALPAMKIELCHESGEQCVYLNGENLGKRIREPEISMYASKVSAIPEVRSYLLQTQRRIAQEHDVIMDGRDIGTVILPDADVKIFMFASPEARAKRRLAELQEKGMAEGIDLAAVLADMIQRDHDDSTRAVAPAVAAADAVLFDNSDYTFEESVSYLLRLIAEKTGRQA